MTGPAGYDELVAAATVGLDRRPLRLAGLAGPAAAHAGVLDAADPAAALLEAAALLSSARRAGLRPASATPPAPAPADTTPALSAVASAILADALRSDPELAADLLAAAAAAGRRAAPPVLPELLDAAVRHRALRQPASAVLGERGRWLAGYREDWRRMMAAVTDNSNSGTGIGNGTDISSGTGSHAGADNTNSEEDESWRTGGRGERRAWLAALRRRDPAAARELLAAGWDTETGDDRADLLAVLAAGLSPADEPFLESALDDRKQAVRQVAGRLLAALPGSAFTARAIARGTAVLSVGRRGLRPVLTVTLPAERDAAAARDGVPAAPAGAVARGRAWLVIQYIAGVPLAEWTARLGLSPARLLALAVPGGFGAEVHAGWRKAAVTQRDAAWAAALLSAAAAEADSAPPAARAAAASADTELAMVLPSAERVAWAQRILSRAGPGPQAAAALAACRSPWPASLADAVLAQLARGARSGRPSRGMLVILPLAARMLPASGDRDYAADLRALALTGPASGDLLSRLHRAADVIACRRRFLQELH
ncbi:MAG TPA: DUF5691 domain-containing protein [Streptosporangiaceae bacterium]|nr:DUF5691 domain-containing protein [Streptosporangiaceae bacterium]